MRVHDTFFQRLLGDRERMVEYMRTHLPAALSSSIAWESVREEPWHFIDTAHREQYSDKIFSGRIEDRDGALCFLCVHQPTVIVQVLLTQLTCMMQLWEQWRIEHPTCMRPPLIVTLVAYRSERDWTCAPELSGRYDFEDLKREDLDRALADFGAVLEDLSSTGKDPQQYTNPYIRWAIATLRHTQHPERTSPWSLEAMAEDLAQVSEPSPEDLDLLAKTVRRILDTHTEPLDMLLNPLLSRLPEAANRAVLTAAEKLRQEGRDAGRREGRIELLVLLLRARGLTIAHDEMSLLSSLNVAQLDRLAARALTVERVSDLLAEG